MEEVRLVNILFRQPDAYAPSIPRDNCPNGIEIFLTSIGLCSGHRRGL